MTSSTVGVVGRHPSVIHTLKLLWHHTLVMFWGIIECYVICRNSFDVTHLYSGISSIVTLYVGKFVITLVAMPQWCHTLKRFCDIIITSPNDVISPLCHSNVITTPHILMFCGFIYRYFTCRNCSDIISMAYRCHSDNNLGRHPLLHRTGEFFRYQ